MRTLIPFHFALRGVATFALIFLLTRCGARTKVVNDGETLLAGSSLFEENNEASSHLRHLQFTTLDAVISKYEKFSVQLIGETLEAGVQYSQSESSKALYPPGTLVEGDLWSVLLDDSDAPEFKMTLKHNNALKVAGNYFSNNPDEFWKYNALDVQENVVVSCDFNQDGQIDEQGESCVFVKKLQRSFLFNVIDNKIDESLAYFLTTETLINPHNSCDQFLNVVQKMGDIEAIRACGMPGFIIARVLEFGHTIDKFTSIESVSRTHTAELAKIN